MTRVKGKILYIVLAFMMLLTCVLIAACGGGPIADGDYTENGIKYRVTSGTASVVGVEENTTEITIPIEFSGAKVSSIANGALAESTLTKVSFEQAEFSSFTVSADAFNGSDITTIENLPANATLDQDAFSGLSNLESISVYGQGELAVENGMLIQNQETSNGSTSKILRLLPAASEPQTNFVNGAFTVTGFSEVFDHAASYNQFITDLVIAEDIQNVETDAFSHIALNSVTIENTDRYALDIDSSAFTAYKDLKILVPATTDSQMDAWIDYGQNFLDWHSWLIHPQSCNRTDAHVHGVRNSAVPSSIQGYTYRVNGTLATITISPGSSGTSVSLTFPDYMTQEFVR